MRLHSIAHSSPLIGPLSLLLRGVFLTHMNTSMHWRCVPFPLLFVGSSPSLLPFVVVYFFCPILRLLWVLFLRVVLPRILFCVVCVLCVLSCWLLVSNCLLVGLLVQ